MTSQLFPLANDPGSLAIRAEKMGLSFGFARRRTVMEWAIDQAARWFGWWGFWKGLTGL